MIADEVFFLQGTCLSGESGNIDCSLVLQKSRLVPMENLD